MRAGQLRHRVTFKEKVVTRDTANAEVVTWRDVATVWAQIEPLVGREFLDQAQMTNQITTRIRVRYVAGLNNRMRIVWQPSDGTHTYEIDSIVTVQESRREMVCMCREVKL
jgi:SPP1 family predicted phage head-tail adaptor